MSRNISKKTRSPRPTGRNVATGLARDADRILEERPRPSDTLPANQAPDPDEFEDDLLPGVEYNLVLTAPPSEIIPCVGRVVAIVRGREDLPMSDEDWRSILIEDDED